MKVKSPCLGLEGESLESEEENDSMVMIENYMRVSHEPRMPVNSHSLRPQNKYMVSPSKIMETPPPLSTRRI